jgi:hypothetical protein
MAVMNGHDDSHGFDDPVAPAPQPIDLPSIAEAAATRERLWDAGFRPVAVRNPIRGDERSGKAPLGRDWRAEALLNPPMVTKLNAVAHALNTGILCDGLRAVDIDVDDRMLATRVAVCANHLLGEAPVRYRDSGSRVLLLYRAAEGAPGKIVLPSPNGKIEVLGAGQQFVAFGAHHSGATLRWLSEAPGDIAASGLLPVTEEQIHAFLMEAAEILGAAPPGAQTTRQTRLPKQPAPASKVNGPLAAALADTISDGREQYMRDWIWGRVLDWHRACPIPPTSVESESACADAFLAWVEHVDSRIPGAHAAKAERLEQEGRGWSEFQRKWHYAMAQWDGKVADEAGKPKPNGSQQQAEDEDDWGDAQSHPGPQGNSYPGTKAPPGPRPLLTKREFMDTFKIPDYIVDGIIQRGRLIAMTSPTGHGKTAVALYLGEMVATGRSIGSLAVEEGEVIFLAGENPDDLCGRMHAAVQHYGTSADCQNLSVMPVNFPMTQADADALRQQIDDRERPASLTPAPLSLIVLDTSASFNPSEDENNNIEMGKWARILRTLTQCRGNPAVLVLCHPLKDPRRDNLLPRGGGAFLNEVDSNLTLWSEEGESTQLFWAGKHRGAQFQAVNFSLVPVTLRDLTDQRGRPITSVVATLQTETEAERVFANARTDENTVLEWLRRNPGISMRDIARNCGWVSDKGVENKGKVHRLLVKMSKEKPALVRQHRGKWVITNAGEEELAGEE